MSRQKVLDEIKSQIGSVPQFLNTVPDNTLELEWNLFQRVQNEPGAIPNKYRELIGIAIASVTKCKYCLFFHTEFAKLNGATPAEIEDAVHYAKSSMGWSTYLTGMSTDFEQFKKDVRNVCGHLQQASASAK